jgi:hypothetical protein
VSSASYSSQSSNGYPHFIHYAEKSEDLFRGSLSKKADAEATRILLTNLATACGFDTMPLGDDAESLLFRQECPASPRTGSSVPRAVAIELSHCTNGQYDPIGCRTQYTGESKWQNEQQKQNRQQSFSEFGGR